MMEYSLISQLSSLFEQVSHCTKSITYLKHHLATVP
jgi:hypothetical protein